MAVFGRTNIKFNPTGHKTTVPNNNKAKLMYYLKCACTVLNLDDDAEINRLKDYDRYENIWRYQK